VRALVTNDDGIDAPGLATLVQAASEHGLDVVVAAPVDESSGSSASLFFVGENGQMLLEQRRVAGFDAPAYAVGAQPAFIVFSAMQGAFGDPPDLVLSGVNHGPNLGHAVLHSGTVGAAVTAVNHGRRALAVSTERGTEAAFAASMPLVRRALDWLVEGSYHTVLNLNVPDPADGAAPELRQAELAPFGAVQATIDTGEGFAKVTVDPIEAEAEPGTDVALLAKGYATVTPLCPVQAAADVDLRDLVG